MRKLLLSLTVNVLVFSTLFSHASQGDAVDLNPQHIAQQSVVLNSEDFDRNALLAPNYRPNSSAGFSFLNPNRFSMQQSYSVSFASGGQGSSSGGLYLNSISYQLANPLWLSMDLGFQTPLYSSGAYNATGKSGLFNHGNGARDASSFVLPRIGLDYKPTENMSFSLQFFNGQDATKAYGPMNPYFTPYH